MRKGNLLIAIIIACIIFGSCKDSHTFIGNIEPLINESYYPCVYSEIASARSYVHIAMFAMKAGGEDEHPVDSLLNLLCRINDSVDVKVILEMDYGDIESTNSYALDYLVRNNVQVRRDPEGITTHAKLIVIDDAVVIVGSTNWTYSAFYDNNETAVLIRNSDIAGKFNEFFEELWQKSSE